MTVGKPPRLAASQCLSLFCASDAHGNAQSGSLKSQFVGMLFTTVLFESPKLLLNVGMGDHGTVYTRSGTCAFSQSGFDTHISNIRSYEKLTGEGVTFVDTDFIRIIEKELPGRFGGQSTDYQLIEEEDGKGLNRLRLLVSPRLGPLEEEGIVRAFIELLRRSEQSPESWAQSGSVMWKQAGTVRVSRASAR